MVKKFEELFANYIGRKYCITVSNGSAALDLAVLALNLPQGSEVILPSFTIISCASAIIRAGLIPVTVDSDPSTWNMNVDDIRAKITPQTRAIMVVHIYGLPAQMNEINSIAQEYNLKIVEDAAEMHGQTYYKKKCGSFGDISTFSFYANKLLTMGEGGAILTDDPHIADQCRSLRNLCFQDKQRFVHEELGWNYRLTNLQAAVGIAQLERVDEFIEIKHKMGRIYHERLGHIKSIRLPVATTEYADNIYWVFGIVLSDQIALNARQFIEKLAAENVGSRPFFFPIHQQPVFKKLGLFKSTTHNIADLLYENGFYIPSGLGLSENMIDKVCTAVEKIAHQYSLR